MLAYVDHARRAAPDGAGQLEASFAADELGLALRLPTVTVQQMLARTRRVRARLPQVWDLHVAGRIDAYRVQIIDEAAQRLVFGDSLLALDAQVAEVAVDKTPGQLRAWLARFVARTEPGQSRQRYRRAFGNRTVYTVPEADGMGWLCLYHTGLDLAAVEARLEAMARSLGADDPRSMDQRKADLAIDLLLGRFPNGATTAEPADNLPVRPTAEVPGRREPATTPSTTPSTTVGVVVPVQSLVGEAETPGQTVDGQHSVPAEVIRRHAVEPGTLFYRLLTDTDGNLLQVTEAGRYASDKLGFAVAARDATSRFPTSTVPAARCDVDHTRPYDAGGPTTAANLGPLDRRTHNAKTRGLLRLRQPEPGTFVLTTSTGHTYTTRPESLPVADWPDTADHAEHPESCPHGLLHPGDLHPADPLIETMPTHIANPDPDTGTNNDPGDGQARSP